MPVRVLCPYCQTPCLVAEKHLGVPVQCGRCARTFTTRVSAQGHRLATVPRLDIGAAASERPCTGPQQDRYLVRHLIWTHLDERHELTVLAIASSPPVRTVCAGLAPLLTKALGGTSKDAAGVPEAIAGVLGETKLPTERIAIVVVWDGQAYLSRATGCRLYHYHGGQLSAIAADKPSQLALAPGDWLATTTEEPRANLDTKTLQDEIAKASSAAGLSQQWAERNGSVVVALRAS